MTKYEFVEEHDMILNEYWYFTRENGLCMSGSMSQHRHIAYDFFSKKTSTKPVTSEEIIECIFMITK